MAKSISKIKLAVYCHPVATAPGTDLITKLGTPVPLVLLFNPSSRAVT